MKNIRLTVWIGMMCGCLAAGMLQAGTRPDNACPAEEDDSRLWLPVMRPAEGAEVECRAVPTDKKIMAESLI